MSLDRVSEFYYTAAEARAVLGLNEHTFQNWVRVGKIHRTKLPGKGQGVYLKRDVNRLAQTIESAMLMETTADLEYKRATPLEIDAEIYLAYLIYGKKVLKPEAREARAKLIEVNPESTWFLYDREILAASMNVVPVQQEAIERFKKGERGWLFVPDLVKQFEPGEPLECILIDFMRTPAAPPEKRRGYPIEFLRNFSDKTLRGWGARGIEISKLYTCGSTDDGRRLLRGSDFVELGEPVKGRVIFELDINKPTPHLDKLLEPYRANLAAWKEQQK